MITETIDFNKLMIDGVGVLESVSNKYDVFFAQSWPVVPADSKSDDDDATTVEDECFKVYVCYKDYQSVENNKTFAFNLNKKLDFGDIQIKVFEELQKYKTVDPFSYNCAMDIIAISCDNLLHQVITHKRTSLVLLVKLERV
ncbi:unnamed protein product [Amaranthus hypochondriacus]